MKVERRMRGRVITVQLDDCLERAQTLMAVHNIRHLPVLDGQRLVGVVSERDLLGVMVQQRRRDCGTRAGKAYFLPSGVRVHEVMTADPVVVAPETDVEEVARLLIDRKIGCLPVVDRERLVGIITAIDVLGVLAEILGLIGASSRIDIALGRDPQALERTSEIIRRHHGRIIGVGISLGRGRTPRIHHFRLESCDTAPIASSLRRAGFRVVERHG